MTDPNARSEPPEPERLYEETMTSFTAPLARLARAYEPDAHLREDLTQEIHLALWRSFSGFDGKCSLRTWVYRIAHNTAATHVVKDRNRRWRQLVSLDEIDALPNSHDVAAEAERRLEREALAALVQQLKPLDRQIMVLYLEGLDAASIAEITGLSSANVAVKVHRVKKILVERARQGGKHAR
jgi:RNA polymerase sigma-70 factor, ECF subfamily